MGCEGGWMNNSFEYIRDHGISALSNYPYTSNKQKCKNDTTPRVNIKLTNYTILEKSEEALRQAVGK